MNVAYMCHKKGFTQLEACYEKEWHSYFDTESCPESEAPKFEFCTPKLALSDFLSLSQEDSHAIPGTHKHSRNARKKDICF